MKKNKLIHFFLTSFILFQHSISYAQEPGKWSKPEAHPCFRGIIISVVNMGKGSVENDYLWGVKFTNNYDVPVTFKYKLSIGEKITSKYGGDVAPLKRKGDKGDTWIDGGDKFTAKLYHSSAEEWFIYIWDVCFDGMRCGGADECYADCDKDRDKDNPKPNQPCGLSSSPSLNTPEINNEPKEMSGTLSAGIKKKEEDKTPDIGETSNWKRDDETVEVNMGKTAEGIYWKRKQDKQYSFLKKLPDGSYVFDAGKDFYSLKFASATKVGFYKNNVLENYYFLDGEKKETENNQALSITSSSEWKRVGHDNQRYFIAITNDALLYCPKGAPYPSIYNKTSEILYEFNWKSMKRRKSSIEFLSSTSLLMRHTGGNLPNIESSYVQVSPDEIEKKYTKIVQGFPSGDIKGEWNLVGVSDFNGLILKANVEGLYASFGTSYTAKNTPLVILPYTKVHEYFYTYDTDTAKSWIRYINDTTLSISYQYRNLKTLSYYTRPAAAPIVKQENKPVSTSDISADWRTEDGSITLTLLVKDNGLYAKIKGSSDETALLYKKISATEYRRDYSADTYEIVRVISNDKMETHVYGPDATYPNGKPTQLLYRIKN